jgi:hypothetical protein
MEVSAAVLHDADRPPESTEREEGQPHKRETVAVRVDSNLHPQLVDPVQVEGARSVAGVRRCVSSPGILGRPLG